MQTLLRQEKLLEICGTNLLKLVNNSDEKMVAVGSGGQTFWESPTLVGAYIVDSAKFLLVENRCKVSLTFSKPNRDPIKLCKNALCFQVLVKTFDCSPLYSDTDSLLYETSGHDFYETIANDFVLQVQFCLSNYLHDNLLDSEVDKIIAVKLKDHMAGIVIQEMIGLKPILYSIAYESVQNISPKTITLIAQTSLKHGVCKRSLLSAHQMRSHNIRISSTKHRFQTNRNSK